MHDTFPCLIQYTLLMGFLLVSYRNSFCKAHSRWRWFLGAGLVDEARQILEFLRREISPDTYVNIMEQYRPTFKVSKSWNFCTGKSPRILTSTSWSSTDPPSRLVNPGIPALGNIPRYLRQHHGAVQTHLQGKSRQKRLIWIAEHFRPGRNRPDSIFFTFWHAALDSNQSRRWLHFNIRVQRLLYYVFEKMKGSPWL